MGVAEGSTVGEDIGSADVVVGLVAVDFMGVQQVIARQTNPSIIVRPAEQILVNIDLLGSFQFLGGQVC